MDSSSFPITVIKSTFAPNSRRFLATRLDPPNDDFFEVFLATIVIAAIYQEKRLRRAFLPGRHPAAPASCSQHCFVAESSAVRAERGIPILSMEHDASKAETAAHVSVAFHEHGKWTDIFDEIRERPGAEDGR